MSLLVTYSSSTSYLEQSETVGDLAESGTDTSSPPESPMSTSSDRPTVLWDPYSERTGEYYLEPKPNLNQLKRSNSDSDMKVASLSKKQPRFATKYDELLQPLSPVTTLPVKTKQGIPVNKTHLSHFDEKLQKHFQRLLGFPSNVSEVEAFLSKHSESVDLNEYNDEGRTALQQCCYEGNLRLAQLLVRFGADCSLTTREGFSALHIAAFSGHSDVLLFIMSLKHR